MMQPSSPSGWRHTLYRVIFEADTPAGRAFDVVLIGAILTSVLVVALDSVPGITAEHGRALLLAEWGFTILFTVEYVLRLLAVARPGRYARSFFGVVDLLAILPTYVSLLFPAGRFLMVVRVLRVLRIFRVLKLVTYVGEAGVLARALHASRPKITIFLVSVFTLVVIVGSLMYLIEGPAAGFTSIPKSIYWAIVTLSTVGYGDIAPRTAVGQALAAIVMITGYAIIAVPTGIVTVELSQAAMRAPGADATGTDASPAGPGAPPTVPEEAARRSPPASRMPEPQPPWESSPRVDGGAVCRGCGFTAHDQDAAFCKRCGARL